MAKLTNMLRRLRTFNLEHPSLCDASGKPGVLTLHPRATVEVSPDVLECTEIKNALNPTKGRPTLRQA